MFTHLHVASGYSLRYGPSHPERLVQRAAERGMGSLALTDRDNVTGMVRFAHACASAGVRPVFGVDLAVAQASPVNRSHSPAAAPRRRTPVRGGAHGVPAGGGNSQPLNVDQVTGSRTGSRPSSGIQTWPDWPRRDRGRGRGHSLSSRWKIPENSSVSISPAITRVMLSTPGSRTIRPSETQK